MTDHQSMPNSELTDLLKSIVEVAKGTQDGVSNNSKNNLEILQLTLANNLLLRTLLKTLEKNDPLLTKNLKNTLDSNDTLITLDPLSLLALQRVKEISDSSND